MRTYKKIDVVYNFFFKVMVSRSRFSIPICTNAVSEMGKNFSQGDKRIDLQETILGIFGRRGQTRQQKEEEVIYNPFHSFAAQLTSTLSSQDYSHPQESS